MLKIDPGHERVLKFVRMVLKRSKNKSSFATYSLLSVGLSSESFSQPAIRQKFNNP